MTAKKRMDGNDANEVHVYARLTRDEKARLKAAARASGRTISGMMRWLALREIGALPETA